MSSPFISEIRIASFSFAPRGWAFCNGQLLPINQNQALFSLLGTTYGGNGQTTFALPNLQGNVPVHPGSGFNLGQTAGEAAHTLTIAETPAHTHTLLAASDAATTLKPAGARPAAAAAAVGSVYAAGPVSTLLASSSIGTIGGQAHANMQPYLVLNFIIALQGIFPSRN